MAVSPLTHPKQATENGRVEGRGKKDGKDTLIYRAISTRPIKYPPSPCVVAFYSYSAKEWVGQEERDVENVATPKT